MPSCVNADSLERVEFAFGRMAPGLRLKVKNPWPVPRGAADHPCHGGEGNNFTGEGFAVMIAPSVACSTGWSQATLAQLRKGTPALLLSVSRAALTCWKRNEDPGSRPFLLCSLATCRRFVLVNHCHMKPKSNVFNVNLTVKWTSGADEALSGSSSAKASRCSCRLEESEWLVHGSSARHTSPPHPTAHTRSLLCILVATPRGTLGVGAADASLQSSTDLFSLSATSASNVGRCLRRRRPWKRTGLHKADLDAGFGHCFVWVQRGPARQALRSSVLGLAVTEPGLVLTNSSVVLLVSGVL